MTKYLLLFFVHYFLLSKLSYAQVMHRSTPNTPPTSKAPTSSTPAPTLAPTPPNSPPLERIAKCYPETATAYFLPAPPSQPKVTILDPKFKDVITNFNKNSREKCPNVIKEVPTTSKLPSPNKMSDRVSFPPPPLCTTGLPDMIDEIPSRMQDRFSRLAESSDKAPVCETCASMIKKLPIFNFDQDLVKAFLDCIGI